MINRISLCILLLVARATVMQAQVPPLVVETSRFTQSPAYPDIIRWWKALDRYSPQVSVQTMGPTDSGYPLHLVWLTADGDCNIRSLKQKDRRIILINNGIHPGEPDGIDASMLLARDVVLRRIQLPKNIALAIIPVYNIGGCLNRSTHYRVDQNGPEAFGSRGNAQNLDLNRDMVKCDSKNAQSLTEIFHLLDPDVFVDNHVSNGADYQHIMTLLTTQHTKLGGLMGRYLHEEFEPALYTEMKQKGYDLIPYVNVWGDTPEKGWSDYWDSPRYVSGFAALWHIFSFVPETHMLKSYEQRVRATQALLACFVDFTSRNSSRIRDLRNESKRLARSSDRFPIKWKLDRTQYKEYPFKGYEAGYKTSEVSGQQRLYYDRSKPFEKPVRIYDHYSPTDYVRRPKAYIIPQGWWRVVGLLKQNRVRMERLASDTIIGVEVYRIEDYKSLPRPYEQHHLNAEVRISVSHRSVPFRKGDWYIPMDQDANRFLIETLEPEAEDSYFAWNFFDAILGQKEGYSAYVFEDIAAEHLRKHPELAAKLAARRATDTVFAKSARAQLDFVYQHSPWYEPAHNTYPVYRVR